MGRSKLFGGFLGISLLIFGFMFVGVRNHASARSSPNILFITVDTLRSDHLASYGYEKIKTPHIDSLAQKGTLFKNVISHTPLTMPSHASIFTGTYPQFHGVRDNGYGRLKDEAVTLAEVLQQEDYATAAFVSTFVLNAKFGLNQGFETYDDVLQDRDPGKIIKHMEGERTADQVTGAAVQWLKDNHDKPFFLWVHYYDPHSIYNPPSPYKEIYKDNPYDGEIAFTDEQIGVLLSSLSELGLDKNTMIVFTSDHGESLGEHGENGHAVFVYDTTQKVPLIFVYPKEVPQEKMVENQVRHVDIMPTVLDFLRMKKNPQIQGTSLARLIKKRSKGQNLPAYSESLYANKHYNWSDLKAYRKRPWKYIQSSKPELYHIEEDPGEVVNLAEKRPDLVQKLDRELEQFLKKTTSEESDQENKEEIDEETRERLMSLGYIHGAVETETDGPVPIEMIQVMEKMNHSARLANEGLLDQAIEGFHEVIEKDSRNVEAHIQLAQVYRAAERYDEAIEYFRKAASFKPEGPEVHDGLGNIYKDMGRVDEAFKEFSIALELDPENPAIINNIGWCYQQKMDFAKALEYYKQALEIDNEIATAHANIAICYRVQGRLEEAEKELMTALEQDPELAFAHSELCALTAIKGDLDGAIAHCQQAVELDPEGLDGYNNLGVCYERKGDFKKALENYLAAARIAPWNPLVHFHIGNAYANLNQFDKAIQSYNKVLSIDPHHARATQMLFRLLPHMKSLLSQKTATS